METTQAHRQFSVYVAGAATPDAAARVDAAIAALRSAGFVVTCTWPGIVAATPGGANPRDASDAQRRAWTTQDLNEIDAADAVWFLVPTPPATTRGAWFESGYAYSEKKHLVFSGDTKQSVFCALGVEFASDDGALAYLRGLRDRRRVEDGLAELAANAPAASGAPFDEPPVEPVPTRAQCMTFDEVTPLPPAPDDQERRLESIAAASDRRRAQVEQVRAELDDFDLSDQEPTRG